MDGHGRVLRRRSDKELVAGLAGLAFVYVAEQLLPPGGPRSVMVSLGWLGFAIGALFGCARALVAAHRRERLPWVLVGAGVVAWTFGQMTRAAFLIAELEPPSPGIADAAALTAAVLFGVGFVAFLRGQRLAVYALVLDAGAVTLAMVAVLAFVVQDVFIGEMRADPLATSVVLLYTLLYSAATGAALSALFAVPVDHPRRAFIALFAGVGLTAVAYGLSLPQYVHGVVASGTPVDLLWMAGMFAISLAPTLWLEDRAGRVGSPYSRPLIQMARMALPAVVAVTMAVLLIAGENRATEDVVDASAALVTVVLAVRAWLALYANWRLGEIEGRRARQFEALYEVGLAAAGERSVEELLKMVVEQATGLSRCDGAMLALAERGQGFVIRALYKGPMLGLRDSMGERLRGISLAALETRDLVVAERYAEHPHSTPELRDLIRSALAIPLVAHGEVIGTLAMYSATPRRFSSDTRRLARLYAAQAAVAIANTQLLEETHRLATNDDLTGALNRRVLVERLESEVHEATRHGDIFAVVLCDVDGLKTVNDSAGHLAGNEVLIKVAADLRESVRGEDVVARFGGDEFVLLLPRTGLLPAQALVSRVAQRLRDERYHWAGQEQAVPRVSFGIAWFPEDGRTADALLAAADQRMYEDKATAREKGRGAAGAD